MDENKQKNYKVEWSFSFEKLGDQIGDFFKSVGAEGSEEIKHGEFSEPLGGASSARVPAPNSTTAEVVAAMDEAGIERLCLTTWTAPDRQITTNERVPAGTSLHDRCGL